MKTFLITVVSETLLISTPWDLYEYFDPETHYNRHSWGDNNWQVFVELADHADIEKVSAKIRSIKSR